MVHDAFLIIMRNLCVGRACTEQRISMNKDINERIERRSDKYKKPRYCEPCAINEHNEVRS